MDNFTTTPDGRVSINGEPSIPLSNAAVLLSQDFQTGNATVTGDSNYSQQLVQMAGGKMSTKGIVTSSAPGFLQNTGTAINDHLYGASADTLTKLGKQYGTVDASQSFGNWIETGAANFSLIAFGAVLAVAALIYSQKSNIQTVIKKGSELAALAV